MCVRLTWIYVGLPDVVYVDSYKFVHFAREIILNGDPAPAHFQNPALYTYLLALVYGVFGIEDLYALYLSARLVSAFFGVALTWLVWMAARQVMSRSMALVAAALVAVDVLLVTISRIPATDSLLVFGLALALWAIARTEMRPLHFGVAAFALGMAVSTKWTGLYLVPFYGVLTLVWMIRERRIVRPGAGLLMVLGGGLLVFLLINPYFVSHFDDYHARFLHEMNVQRYGNIGSVQSGWLDYFWSREQVSSQPWLGQSIIQNQGALVLLFAFAGVCLAAFRRHWPLLVHSLFVIGYLLLIVRPGHLMTARFLVPVIPSLFILAAYSAGQLIEKFRDYKMTISALVLTLLLIIPLARTYAYISRADGPMTPTFAALWIAENLPQDTVIHVSPFFLDNFRVLPQDFRKTPNVPSRLHRIPGQPHMNGELTPIYHRGLIDEFRSQGVEYVVTASWFDDAFLPGAGNKRWFPRSVAGFREWQESLSRETELIWSIDAAKAGVLGPDIRVYRLLDHPADNAVQKSY